MYDETDSGASILSPANVSLMTACRASRCSCVVVYVLSNVSLPAALACVALRSGFHNSGSQCGTNTGTKADIQIEQWLLAHFFQQQAMAFF